MAEFRKLKAQARQWLERDDWQQALARFEEYPPERLVGPFFSLLLHSDVVKWRAVTALGLAISRMADADMAAGRVVMRRLLWNLSEESGNLGWGAPETMGEIMAVHQGLGREFHRVLVSYIIETGKDDNFIEHLSLRLGAHWGVGRMAEARPELALSAVAPCLRGLQHPDGFENEQDTPTVRGMSAWTLGSVAGLGQSALDEAEECPGGVCMDLSGVAERLECLLSDSANFTMYRNRELQETSVADMAREALDKLPV